MHQLPDLAILAITVAVLTALAMAAPHFGRHVLRLPANKERDEAAFDAYKAVMSMVGVVLAFSLVEANGILHNVEAVVGREAATLETTDRVLLRIGKPEWAALRPGLANYAETLIKDEWPRLAAGQRSDAADDAFTAVSKAARAIAPDDARQQAMYNELLRGLDDLSDLREEVLSASAAGLPNFFWITISGLLLIALALAFLTESSLTRTVGVGAPTAAIALLLAFVIIIDLPFEGETSVTPDAIQKALVVNSHRK